MRPSHILLTLVMAAAVPAQAQRAFDPARPISVVIPNAAGGASELEIRMYMQKYTEYTGQTVTYDHRAGAGTVIGNSFVAKAPPDGHTLMMVTSTFTIIPSIYKNVDYDPRAFSPVSLLSKRPYLLIAHPSLPAKNMAEYFAYARANPEKINYGTTGPGGAIHMAGAWLHHAAGVKVTYVHYKGSSQIYPDLTTGRLNATLAQPQSGLPHVRKGTLKVLGAAGAERMKMFPDLATAAEQGAKGYDYSGWLGIVGTPGIPAATLNRISAELAKATRSPDIVKKLNDAVAGALADPAVKQKLNDPGAETEALTPQALTAFLQTEDVAIGELAKSGLLKPE